MKKIILGVIALLPTLILVALFATGHIVFNDAPAEQPETAEKAQSPEDLEKLRAGVQSRLQALQKMTKKEWDEEGKKLGDKAKLRAPTLEEARSRNQKALQALDEKIAAASR